MGVSRIDTHVRWVFKLRKYSQTQLTPVAVALTWVSEAKPLACQPDTHVNTFDTDVSAQWQQPIEPGVQQLLAALRRVGS